ncbi:MULTISPECIES: hypothetical protein [Paenibacillus]|nr:hypothetical protein [Paenibacillus amylolyticus]WFR65022.1 hypothetical protein P9222_13990 [Paenibacillus amylolyticus]
MRKRRKRRQQKQDRLEQYVMGVLTSVSAGLILILIQRLFQ